MKMQKRETSVTREMSPLGPFTLQFSVTQAWAGVMGRPESLRAFYFLMKPGLGSAMGHTPAGGNNITGV